MNALKMAAFVTGILARSRKVGLLRFWVPVIVIEMQLMMGLLIASNQGVGEVMMDCRQVCVFRVFGSSKRYQLVSIGMMLTNIEQVEVVLVGCIFRGLYQFSRLSLCR